MRIVKRVRHACLLVGTCSLAWACGDDDGFLPPIVDDAGVDAGLDTDTDTDTTDTDTDTDSTDTDTDTDITDTDTDTDTTDTDTDTDITDTDTDTDITDTDTDSGTTDTDTDTTDTEPGPLPDGGLDASVPDETGLDASVPDEAGPDAAPPDDADAQAFDPVYPEEAVVTNARVPDRFVAWEWASDLDEPRGIITDIQGNVLVVEQDSGRIVSLWDDDGDGASANDERMVIAEASGLNHGLALNGGYLYASSATTVYRWTYVPRSNLGPGTAVITDMPAGGNHVTRTLLFDDQYLYVSVGSAGNVDPNSDRARIVRFEISGLGTPAMFATGSVFADGLRNSVGLGLDNQGRVWSVDNGIDNLYDEDLGGEIVNGNPGEEVNLLVDTGAFYGYPYCWSEYDVPGDAGMGPGTQWLLEALVGSTPPPFDLDTYSDAWCQDEDNVVPPVMVLPAHAAPLDILFYPGGTFPDEYIGDALVTLHGSWNATPPVGYKVVRIPFGNDGMPLGTWEPLYEFDDDDDIGPGWQERPVGLTLLNNGTLLVTSDDNADRIIAIGYTGS